MPLSNTDAVYSRTLSGGTLHINRHHGEVAFNDLFDIAERCNPKRAFLFVSKVLGRHIPVSPATMRQVYKQLASQFTKNLPGPVLFIGLAETAVGLGAGVFDELRHRYSDTIYLTSTRHPISGDILCEFREEHSHATDHIIYLPDDAEMRRRVSNARTLVLVDDEATTGNTFINLVAALRADSKLPHLTHIFTVTLTDWSDNALAKRVSLPATSVSLVSGSWYWTPNPGASVPHLPAPDIATSTPWRISGTQCWGRQGMITSVGRLGHRIIAQPGERILVLGSSEFVWQPFLLAERLETEGAKVLFSATTRSPIASGFAIQSAISFADNYGLGMANFVYNVAHQRFDRVLLCIETPADSVDRRLLNALAQVAPLVEVIASE